MTTPPADGTAGGLADIPDWACLGCGKSYSNLADVPTQCPECGEYADDEPK